MQHDIMSPTASVRVGFVRNAGPRLLSCWLRITSFASYVASNALKLSPSSALCKFCRYLRASWLSGSGRGRQLRGKHTSIADRRGFRPNTRLNGDSSSSAATGVMLWANEMPVSNESQCGADLRCERILSSYVKNLCWLSHNPLDLGCFRNTRFRCNTRFYYNMCFHFIVITHVFTTHVFRITTQVFVVTHTFLLQKRRTLLEYI